MNKYIFYNFRFDHDGILLEETDITGNLYRNNGGEDEAALDQYLFLQSKFEGSIQEHYNGEYILYYVMWDGEKVV